MKTIKFVDFTFTTKFKVGMRLDQEGRLSQMTGNKILNRSFLQEFNFFSRKIKSEKGKVCALSPLVVESSYHYTLHLKSSQTCSVNSRRGLEISWSPWRLFIVTLLKWDPCRGTLYRIVGSSFWVKSLSLFQLPCDKFNQIKNRYNEKSLIKDWILSLYLPKPRTSFY